MAPRRPKNNQPIDDYDLEDEMMGKSATLRDVAKALRDAGSNLGTKDLAKALDIQNAKLSDLTPQIKKYQKDLQTNFVKFNAQQFRDFGLVLSKYVLTSPGVKKDRQDVLKAQLESTKQLFKTFKKTGTEKDFGTFKTSLQFDLMRKVSLHGKGGDVEKVKESYNAYVDNLKGITAEQKNQIKEAIKFTDSLEKVGAVLDKFKDKTIDKLKDSIENLPFVGRAAQYFGWSDKISKSIGGGLENSLTKMAKKSAGGGGLGLTGMLGMGGTSLAAIGGIAALAWVTKKLVDEFQDFREAMKSTAEVFKQTQYSTIKYAGAALAARGRLMGSSLRFMPEGVPKTSEIAEIGATVADTLDRHGLAGNVDVLTALAKEVKLRKLSSNELASMVKMMEQMGQSSDIGLTRIENFFKDFRESADAANLSFGDMLQNLDGMTKLANRFGITGKKALADFTAGITKLGVSADSIMGIEDTMLNITESVQKFAVLQRSFARIGVPQFRKLFDYDQWMKASVTGNIEALAKNVANAAPEIAGKYTTWITESKAGNVASGIKAMMLRRTMQDFGIPIEEMVQITQRQKNRQDVERPKNIQELGESGYFKGKWIPVLSNMYSIGNKFSQATEGIGNAINSAVVRTLWNSPGITAEEQKAAKMNTGGTTNETPEGNPKVGLDDNTLSSLLDGLNNRPIELKVMLDNRQIAKALHGGANVT